MMPWFKADDGLSDNVKTRRAGTEAMGLWLLAGTWCARELTDGFVPKSISARWDVRGKYARKLVDAGFWEAAEQGGEQGYRFLNWAQYQPTKAEVEAERSAAAKRMKAVRDRRKGMPPDGERSEDVRPNVPANEQTNGPRTFASSSFEVRPNFERSSASPTRPVPIDDHLGGERPVTNARENAPPPRCCADHPDGSPPDCGRCQEALRAYTAWTAQQVAEEFATAGRCPRHQDVENPPDCGPCADARRARDRRQAEHVRRLAAAQSGETHAAAAARAADIRDCSLCDPDGYAGTTLCDHDPDSADRAHRHVAAIKADLANRKAAQP